MQWPNINNPKMEKLFRMKLHLMSLTGLTKYETSAVKGMEQRRTNVRPKTIPPGYKTTKLVTFMDNMKLFHAVKNTYQFSKGLKHVNHIMIPTIYSTQ